MDRRTEYEVEQKVVYYKKPVTYVKPVKRLKEAEIIYVEPEKEIVYVPVLIQRPPPAIEVPECNQSIDVPSEPEVEQQEEIDEPIPGQAKFEEVETKYESSDKLLKINMVDDMFIIQDEPIHRESCAWSYTGSAFKSHEDYSHERRTQAWSYAGSAFKSHEDYRHEARS